jgi:large conductance mechanosensitive channel
LLDYFTKKGIRNTDGNSYADLCCKTAGAAVITYGNLVQAIINFVIIAFLYFLYQAAEKAKKLVVAAAHWSYSRSY